MPIAHLIERSVLKITGDDARKFLDGLFTNDMSSVNEAEAGYGALLTPQGKIIVDFFVVGLAGEDGGGFLLDVPRAMLPDLARRLSAYKLRSRVAIEDLTETAAVLAASDGGRLPPDCGIVYRDPRYAGMGDRAIVDAADAPGLADATAEDYHDHRIAVGMPDGGKDFAYAGLDAFPHEALLDQLGGVSFTKGCYVGQEVVSRVQHRGTARSRIVPIVFVEGLRSEWEVDVTAGERVIGRVGSTAKGRGLATVRLDKVADALAAGEQIRAGGLDIRIEKPPFVRFPFPGEQGFGESGHG
jgi:tRNA-modifying protein YgfZ